MPKQAYPDHESASKMSEASSSLSESTESHGKLDRVTIELADNGGFIVECMYRPKPSRKNESMPSMPYEPPKRKVFSDLHSLVAFLNEVLSQKAPVRPPSRPRAYDAAMSGPGFDDEDV